MVVEIRDWCQNVGEYNTYNFCIWHFGLCVIVSKIDRCRSSDPPYEIAINPWWRGGRGLPSLIALFIYGSECEKYIFLDIWWVLGRGGGGFNDQTGPILISSQLSFHPYIMIMSNKETMIIVL